MRPAELPLAARAASATVVHGTFEQPEHRKESRFRAERAIQIRHGGQDLDAWLVDCSRHGVQLVTRQAVECGHLIQLHVKLHGVDRLAPYRVRYWFKLWADSFQVGADLADPIDDTQAAILLQELLSPRHDR